MKYVSFVLFIITIIIVGIILTPIMLLGDDKGWADVVDGIVKMFKIK